jgi:hypothetical protein
MKSRNVILALLGVAVLVGASRYAGPGEQAVRAYAGNLAVSFALYFATLSATQRWPRSRLGAALITLSAVTLFEISDGFGVMDNVFDQWDFVANGAGLALAVITDVVTARLTEGPGAPRTSS